MEERRRRSLWDALSPARWMRRDWDRRAREDAQHYIACGHAETDAAFWESGRWDLDHLVLHDVELSPRAHGLEIGCGLGRLLRPLSERIERVYGVDISREMVTRAQQALADRGNVDVAATTGRLNRISDASLDLVFSFIVFQHVPSKRAVIRYIREASRVLRGGGVFRFQVDGRPRPKDSRADSWLGVWFEPRELARQLFAAKFEIVSSWGEGTHYYWVTARRRPQRGRSATAAVQCWKREWRSDRLRALLERMGADAAAAGRAVMAGDQTLKELAESFLASQEKIPAADFVRRAYEVFLGRPPDAGGLAFYSKEIESGIPRSNTVDCLLSSSEAEDNLRTRVTEPAA
jgi:SAM-dependent methyltransferase